MAFDWPGVGTCSAPIGPRVCSQTSSHVGSLSPPRGRLGVVVLPPLRPVEGLFALCSRAPQAATPVGTRPGAASAPCSLPLPFTSQLPRSWKVGAGASPSRPVFLWRRSGFPRASGHYSGGPVERGLTGSTQLVGR